MLREDELSPRERVLAYVRDLALGEITTYGRVARATGASPREVGWIMAGNADDTVPWWRVVAANGVISTFRRDPHLGARQLALLKSEGATVVSDRRVRLPDQV